MRAFGERATAGTVGAGCASRDWCVRRTLGGMAPDTATLIRDALALDADQRAVVANALLESFHGTGDTDEVDAAWHAEATRRLAEVRAGAVELVDADEHYARLRASRTA